MTSEAYKKLSIKEFDYAAEKFDDSNPSIYNAKIFHTLSYSMSVYELA